MPPFPESNGEEIYKFAVFSSATEKKALIIWETQWWAGGGKKREEDRRGDSLFARAEYVGK